MNRQYLSYLYSTGSLSGSRLLSLNLMKRLPNNSLVTYVLLTQIYTFKLSTCFTTPGARFSKDPETFLARKKILKLKPVA